MQLTADQKARLAHRATEVVREIGVLLLAFAPLEFTLQTGTASAIAMWLFVATGAAFLAVSLYYEVKR